MLILTRRPQQVIVVDGPCEVRVLRIEKQRVTLGFSGPDSTVIRRAEIAEERREPVGV